MADAVVTIPLAGQPFGCLTGPNDRDRPSALAQFLVGPENRLVAPVVARLLEHRPCIYNPLVIYGPSGTGKSHLAYGLAAAWKSVADRRVVYVSAADFARELADAIDTQAVGDLRCRYRCVSLLVIEDLAQLADKPAAQEELVYTLDVLLAGGGQVIITTNAAPGKIRGLLPSLRGRLTAGLCLPLAMPGQAARLEILRRLAELRGVKLAEPAARLFAESLGVSVPELAGAFVQLYLPTHQDGHTIDTRVVRRFLSERGSQRPQIHQIASLVARHFAVRLADLRGASRRRPIVAARDVAIYLARILTAESLEQIGRYFGGRDHTTIMYSCRKLGEPAKNDPEIRQAIDCLQQKITGGCPL